MIQRIQSIFLLGSVLASVLLLYLPLYEFQVTTDPTAVATEFHLSANKLLLIINGAVAVLSFFSIFLYKKRNLQLRATRLSMLLTCMLIILLFFAADVMSSGSNQKINYLYGSYLPLIQVLFLFVAGIYIKRDEELVRSADRLR